MPRAAGEPRGRALALAPPNEILEYDVTLTGFVLHMKIVTLDDDDKARTSDDPLDQLIHFEALDDGGAPHRRPRVRLALWEQVRSASRDVKLVVYYFLALSVHMQMQMKEKGLTCYNVASSSVHWTRAITARELQRSCEHAQDSRRQSAPSIGIASSQSWSVCAHVCFAS